MLMVWYLHFLLRSFSEASAARSAEQSSAAATDPKSVELPLRRLGHAQKQAERIAPLRWLRLPRMMHRLHFFR